MAFNTGGAGIGAASTGITAFSATGNPYAGLAGAVRKYQHMSRSSKCSDFPG